MRRPAACRTAEEPFFTAHESLRDEAIDGFWGSLTAVTPRITLASLAALLPASIGELAAGGVRSAVILCSEQLVQPRQNSFVCGLMCAL